MSKPKYKIRYRDNMTTYLIDMVFNSIEQAEYYIECDLGDSSLYEVETTNHDIETEEDPKQFYNLLKGENKNG